jgi:putative transposase
MFFVSLAALRGHEEYAMNEGKGSSVLEPVGNAEVLKFGEVGNARSILDQIVRDGARKMLQAALEDEVNTFLEAHSSKVDENGRRLVIRNGYMPSRELVTGAGNLDISQPRVRDKSSESEDRVKFSSSILPPYLRRSKAIDELIPWLYLKGISTGDFSEALQSLTGAPVEGVSANTIVRLKEKWSEDYDTWNKRDLSSKQYVYIWADGIHVNVRLEDAENQRQCILVLMGATQDGEKELIAVRHGFRESEASWTELLNDVKARGLKVDPQLAIGDGALGFWAAVRKVFTKIREQRCWFHKSGNVLNCFPKSVQPRAKEALHEIWMAETREEAYKAFTRFGEMYGAKYPKAWECLEKDKEELLAFYDFPAEHWKHLRTTNPIESTFATIRLRHRKTKGSGNRKTSLVMMFKIAESASKRWRRLDGHTHIISLLEGKKFVNGILQVAA